MRAGGLMTRLADEQGLTFLLVSLVVLLFVVYPFFSLSSAGQVLVDVFLSLVLLSSAAAVQSPRLRKIAVWLALGTVTARVLLYLRPTEGMRQLRLLLAIAYLMVAIVLLLVRVFAKGRVTFRRIQGAVAGYLLVGLAFGLAFALIEMRGPEAFALGRGATAGIEEFTYFSFITLTTVGYGDFTPLSPLAKQMTLLEGLIGQLFPTILIARLVSLQISDSDRGDR